MESLAHSSTKTDEIILIIIDPSPSLLCFIHFVLINEAVVKVIFSAIRPFLFINLNIYYEY